MGASGIRANSISVVRSRLARRNRRSASSSAGVMNAAPFPRGPVRNRARHLTPSLKVFSRDHDDVDADTHRAHGPVDLQVLGCLVVDLILDDHEIQVRAWISVTTGVGPEKQHLSRAAGRFCGTSCGVKDGLQIQHEEFSPSELRLSTDPRDAQCLAQCPTRRGTARRSSHHRCLPPSGLACVHRHPPCDLTSRRSLAFGAARRGSRTGSAALSQRRCADTSARPRSTPAAPNGRPDQPNTRPANTPSPLATLPRRSPWTGRACGNAAASRRVSGASPVEPPVK